MANFDFNTKTDGGKERRAAARHRVNLDSSVSITAFKNAAAESGQRFALAGQLIDVSESGLGIAIEYRDLRDMQRFGSDLTLLLSLNLSVETIEFEVALVRAQQLNDGRILLGARIAEMNEHQRAIFDDFISQCG